ncbi:MAG: porin, partial [Rhodobacteraceae bacterium]|nr:porin [Paracoccaceae bacterium]
MKKILLASTALVLSAGLAHAQAVTITGSGRMGITGMDAGGGWNWSQEHRLDLNFNVSVEADHGLTFGAWTRARMEGGWQGVGLV